MSTTSDFNRAIHRTPVDRETLGAPEVLDLDALMERCMGNLDFVDRILHKFQERLPKELAELETTLECQDAEQLALVAHRIKGSSASVSARGLCLAASAIEDRSRAGCMHDIDSYVEQFRREWERYQNYSASLHATSERSLDDGTTVKYDAISTSE